MPPTAHAKLSASSSKRWLHCTAAPGLEATLPDKDPGPFAKEGTLAHEFCEVFGRRKLAGMREAEYAAKLDELMRQEYFDKEMLDTAEFYANYLYEVSMRYKHAPHAQFEIRVDLSDWIPEGFGTCDACIIGGDELFIADYKHGKGVAVDSLGNTQMRLYALGALKFFSPVYGDQINRVTMAIIQPRITEHVNEAMMSVKELLAWGESIKPLALKAYTGEGAEFKAGDWCKFCKAKAVCRARAAGFTALEEFKDINPAALSDTEIGDLLKRGAELTDWYSSLKDYAQERILGGGSVPGWKIVAGRASRVWTDEEKALDAIKAAGYPEAVIYDRKAKTLAQLEKTIGKKDFADICGNFIHTPTGSPTLVVETDRREAYNLAAIEMEGLKK